MMNGEDYLRRLDLLVPGWGAISEQAMQAYQLAEQRRTNDLLERCERALDRIADRLHHAHLGGARSGY